MKYDNETILKNKIAAVNELHTYLNRLIPAYMEALGDSPRVLATGELSKKNKVTIREVENTMPVPYTGNKPVQYRRITWYIKCSAYTISCCVSTYYSTSSDTVLYYERHVNMYRYQDGEWRRQEFIALPVFDYDDVMTRIEEERELRQEIMERVELRRALLRPYAAIIEDNLTVRS